VAPSRKAAWRIVDDATVFGFNQAVISSKIRKFVIHPDDVPPTIVALAATAAAEGRRVPVVLGPPVGGEAQACGLTAAFQGDGCLAISSAPLLRLARAAAAMLVLRAEPEQRRLRVWLAAPGSVGAALEAGKLPEGVDQLSEAALKAEFAAGRASEVWAAAADDTVVGLLAAAFPNGNFERIRVPALSVPPALREMLSMAGSRHAPVVLGPPIGGDAVAQGINARLAADERLVISSVALMSLLQTAHAAAAAAGAPLTLVLRAEPAARRCRLWLARAGSTGRALEAPVMPAGVKQLSEMAFI
jgi:hypothetical protein